MGSLKPLGNTLHLMTGSVRLLHRTGQKKDREDSAKHRLFFKENVEFVPEMQNKKKSLS